MILIKNKYPAYPLMAISIVLSAYIFLNAFELAFNRDIKYISAISEIDLLTFESNNFLNSCSGSSFFNEEKMGKPTIIRITDQARSQIVPAIFRNGWLARKYSLHYSCFLPKDSNVDDLLLYGLEGIRTVSENDEINKGDLITVETDQKWRFIFRVEDIKAHYDQTYVVEDSDKPRLIIFLNQDKGSYIIKSNYLATEKFD